jgi:hypothetical protein
MVGTYSVDGIAVGVVGGRLGPCCEGKKEERDAGMETGDAWGLVPLVRCGLGMTGGGHWVGVVGGSMVNFV